MSAYEDKERVMGDPVGTLLKTNSLIRADSNKTSEEISRYLVKRCAELDIKVSYDVTYGNHPEELKYSEFFGGLGGIQVSPCCGSLVRRMYNRGYDESNNFDFANLLDSGEKLLDKYLLHSYDIDYIKKGIVILCGSNILEEVIDKERLNAAMLLGAKLKLHPMTREEHLIFLNEQYSADHIIPSTYSGYNCMLKSNVVYATGTSELGLYAMLLGKTVIDIGTGVPKGGYVDQFSRAIDAPNQKVELNQLLNNPAGGVILPNSDYKVQVDKYLELYAEMLDSHTATVNIPNLSRY